MSILAASPLASRGFAQRGDKKNQGEIRKRTKEISCKRKDQGNLLQNKNGGDFFVFWGVGSIPPPKKIA